MGPNVADVLEEVDAGTAAAIRVKLPRLRYQMWHGKWADAIERMRGLFRGAGAVMESLRTLDAERVGRFRQHLVNLRDYLKSNWGSLTNYGYLHRHDRRISSAPAESGMTHLVNQRRLYLTGSPIVKFSDGYSSPSGPSSKNLISDCECVIAI